MLQDLHVEFFVQEVQEKMRVEHLGFGYPIHSRAD